MYQKLIKTIDVSSSIKSVWGYCLANIQAFESQKENIKKEVQEIETSTGVPVSEDMKALIEQDLTEGASVSVCKEQFLNVKVQKHLIVNKMVNKQKVEEYPMFFTTTVQKGKDSREENIIFPYENNSYKMVFVVPTQDDFWYTKVMIPEEDRKAGNLQNKVCWSHMCRPFGFKDTKAAGGTPVTLPDWAAPGETVENYCARCQYGYHNKQNNPCRGNIILGVIVYGKNDKGEIIETFGLWNPQGTMLNELVVSSSSIIKSEKVNKNALYNYIFDISFKQTKAKQYDNSFTWDCVSNPIPMDTKLFIVGGKPTDFSIRNYLKILQMQRQKSGRPKATYKSVEKDAVDVNDKM